MNLSLKSLSSLLPSSLPPSIEWREGGREEGRREEGRKLGRGDESDFKDRFKFLLDIDLQLFEN